MQHGRHAKPILSFECPSAQFEFRMADFVPVIVSFKEPINSITAHGIKGI